MTRCARGVLLAALLACSSCGERPVVSTYKPVERPVDVVIEIPPFQFSDQTYVSSEQLSIPRGKRIEFRGRILGARRLPAGARRFVTLYTTDGKHLVERTFIKSAAGDTADEWAFTGEIDPLSLTGERHLVVEIQGSESARFMATVTR
jgi:hypothetical protein